jgi:hypothetical protein
MSRNPMARESRSSAQAGASAPQFAGDAAGHASPRDAIVSDDTMPAIIELLVLDEAATGNAGSSDNHDTRQNNESQLPASSHHQHSRQTSREKVMTAQQFEMYRRAMDMHHTAAADDESQDEYEDKDDDEEQRKLAAAKQRQRQEAYLRSRQRERSKVSGGEEKKPAAEKDASIGIVFETWNEINKTPSPPVDVPSSPSVYDDDQDDVPLALLKRSHTPGSMYPGGNPAPNGRRYHSQPLQHSQTFQHTQPTYFVERPQTRLRSHSPGPQLRPLPVLQPMARPQSQMLAAPSHGARHRKGNSVGINMTMGNASLLSLAPQPVQRPHSSGGLIAAIDHLQSPNTHGYKLGPPKDFLGMPVNPPKFYGRRT